MNADDWRHERERGINDAMSRRPSKENESESYWRGYRDQQALEECEYDNYGSGEW